MTLYCSSLQNPSGALKFPEIVIGIACIVLMKLSGNRGYHKIPELGFITCGSSLIFSSCIILATLFTPKRKPKTHLETALNFVASALYLVLAVITLYMDQTCKCDEFCVGFRYSLGIITVLNSVLYGVDAFIAFELLPSFSKTDNDNYAWS